MSPPFEIPYIQAVGVTNGDRMPALVHIRGGGVAANSCAHLLKRAGLRVSMDAQARPRVPVIMLSAAALTMIRDVLDRPSLLSDLPRIDRRIVAWGQSEPVTMPHAAVVVSERQLLANLAVDCAPSSGTDADFVIQTDGSLASGSERRRFGARQAAAAKAVLRDAADASACMIESLENGWLFLIPNPAEDTWLLAVGAPLPELMAKSRLIARRADIVDGPAGAFDCAPSIVLPLCGDRWVACGSAAMAFDPICGDGTAQAVREAILASATITGFANSGDSPSLLEHYESILIAAMRRHLALCADFYRSGGDGPWWQRELEALVEGHRWCTGRLATAPEPRYELKGFELVPRKLAS
jgi:flavin-dependent dehydrogenase